MTRKYQREDKCTYKVVLNTALFFIFHMQIENLLKTKKVEEAIRLAKVAMQTELGSSRDKHVRFSLSQLK